MQDDRAGCVSARLKSDIAKRFEVPERKAKLARYIDEASKSKKATMSDTDLQLYCICRSPDIDRFMIMCDDCEEWFHGDCINVNEKEARHIKYFYCKVCRTKNPFLKIKYRSSKKREERDKSDKKKEKLKKKKLKKKSSEMKDIVHKSASAPVLTSEGSRKYEEDDSWKPPKLRKASVNDKKTSFSIQVCTSDEEQNGTAADKYAFKDDQSDEKIVVNTVKPTKEKKKTASKCGRCENCLRKHDCDACDVCHDRSVGKVVDKTLTCRMRRCLNSKRQRKSESVSTLKRQRQDERSTTPKQARLDAPHRVHVPFIAQSLLPNRFGQQDSGPVKQCYGPGCTNASVRPSKYCSEACGRRLARNRLLQILPQRIQEWNATPTVADDQGRLELERIRTRMEQARTELQALEQKYRRLESIIAAGKSLPVDEKRSETDDDSETDVDQLVYCVVCGHSVSSKSAVKHMDKCYIKIESQMSFGSVYPTRIEGSQRLFCDVYNEQQQTYCKRLQVLCPEHTKEPKVAADDVCGCPLSCDIYGASGPSKPSDFCQLAKRKCNKHFKWETMYRAEVDLQRIRQWLKIDEIFDEERRTKTAMSSRAGLVSLLLHQTTAHDPKCVDMRTKPTVSKKPAYRLMI